MKQFFYLATYFKTEDALAKEQSNLLPRLFKINLQSFLFSLTLVLFSLGALAQTAPVNPPAGGFGIDGDLKANTTIPNVGDWVAGPGGSGGAVFDINGASLLGDKARLVRDPYNDGADISFSSGSKFMDAPNAWQWSAGKPPSKNDINNAMYLVTRDASLDDWLIIGSDRLSINGTSYIDFELLQNTVTRNTTNNGFTTGGTQGGRTVNDLVISMEYSNGGSKPNVIIYQWKQTSPGVFAYVVVPLNTPVGNPARPLSDFVFAETNRTGSVDVPFRSFGNTTYPQYSFVEAAVNMSKVIGALGNPCLGLSIKTIFVKTKASDSPTAALKDVIEPMPVSITFGSASISYATPFCPAGSANVTFGEGSVTGGNFSASPAGLSINNTTGAINLANSTPGSYTVTYSFTQGACTKTTTAPVVIKGLSGAPGTAPISYCQGDVANQLTATGTNLLWYTVPDGGTGSSTAPTPNTASAATTTYYVSQTEAGKCESPRASLVVTVKGLSSAPGTAPVSYCPGDVANQLTATGTNLKWYTTPTGGTGSTTAPTPSTASAGTTTYYVSQTEAGKCEGARAALVVTVKGLSSAPGTAPVPYCQGDVASQLTATGTNLKWYTVPTGGTGSSTAPTPSTATAGTVTYYVSQTEAGKCEGARASLVVTVNAKPEVPNVNVSQPTCAVGTGTITVTSTTSGLQFSLDGGAYASYPVGGYSVSAGPHNLRARNATTLCESGLREVTIDAQPPTPARPVITITEASLCGPVSKPYITVQCPVAGTIYTLTQPGEPAIPPVTYSGTGELKFENLVAGKGFSITAKIGACVSEATTCLNYLANSCPAPSQSIAPLPSAKAPSGSNLAAKAQTEMTAYPIPFSDKATLEFKSVMDEDYVINLYDLKGTLLKQLKSGKAKSGEVIRVEVDGNKMAESMYLARKVSKSGISTVKLLKKR